MTRAAPTLAEIAVAAGVSAMTVSRALNRRPGVSSSLRESIAKRAAGMGYERSRTALHTLLALIASLPAAATQVILPTDLVVRQSTRAPRR